MEVSSHNPRMDHDRHRQLVGQRIQIALEGIGISQRAIARETGIDHSKLNKWISGKFYPDPVWIVSLNEKYGITADFIYLDKTDGLPRVWAEHFRSAASAASKGKVY